MSNPLSPYALLCASKPKPPATVVTPYDLYSAAQDVSRPASFEPVQQPPVMQSPDPGASQASAEPSVPARTCGNMPLVPTRKTHYIADIKTRHNAALKRTSFSAQPLTPPANGR